MARAKAKAVKSPAKKPATKKKPVAKQVAVPAKSSSFNKTTWYARIAVGILLLSTGFWAYLSARLQQGNADQLVNSYLFQDAHTFKEAVLPGQHSFLLKWPIFLLVRALHMSNASYIWVTVGVTLITVAALAYALYRIDRRPLVFGTLCLALASVLVLIPAQPSAGALLPVNMAMIATRNLEYILFIVSLAIIIRWHEVRSWGFWLGVLCLSVVIASDKLFLTLALGGALLAVVAYVFTMRWKLAQVSIKWFVGAVFAGIGSVLILWAINALGVTHISNQVTAGAYGVIHSVKEGLQGILYGVLGFMTNFGANPAYDGLIVRNIPGLVVERLFSIGGLSFVVNGCIMLVGIFVSFKLLIASLLPRQKPALLVDNPVRLSILLLWTTVAAMGAFVLSKHYYAVDARYLTIALFAVFITMATMGRRLQWQSRHIKWAGGLLMISIVLGSLFALQTYNNQQKALDEVSARNSLVGQALSHHQVGTLAGDYWRVVPIKQSAKQNLNVLPLTDCLQPRDILSSGAWDRNFPQKSFAYLLSLDKGLTDYPSCTLDQVIGAYGKPNASAVIAGSFDHPSETLLFYDSGAHKSSPQTSAKTSATVLPIPIDELPNTSCPGLTVMNIVAHEDDDLLFMNPDVMNDIKAGRCVRTVYVTAGDAGVEQFFWLSREQGSQAAYSKMLGTPDDLWVQRVVKIDDRAYVIVANPKGNPKVSLIFMRLPDGNIKGQGFNSSRHESLAGLEGGHVSSLHSVTKQSTYTADQLISALSTLMHAYQPGEIRTQANVDGQQFPDHSDHMAVGRFTQRAYDQYEHQYFEGAVKIPFKTYLGYPVHERPQNVFEPDLAGKQAAFFAYAKHDGTVCQSIEQCQKDASFGFYLSRQYEDK